MAEIQNIKRFTWIDWAKTFAISFVVFGHTPQEIGSFLQSYLVSFHMPFFMFISGYLTKKEYFCTDTLKKYWHTLIIPYFCFNILFYPYWIFRHAIENPHTGVYDYLKPIIGTFMFQVNTDYFESLNGVTWFIIALIIYKIILSLCNRIKYGYIIIVFLVLLSAVLFVLNEFNLYTKELTFIGIMRCMPFFFIGYYFRHKNIISVKPHQYDWFSSLIFLCISLLAYQFLNTNSLITFALKFWIVSMSATIGIFSLCKLLDSCHSTIIENISIGTIVIMGLHFILIGSTNFALEKLLHLDNKIIYPWYVALLLCVLFEAILYPLIILFKTKYPFVLGKSSLQKHPL